MLKTNGVYLKGYTETQKTSCFFSSVEWKEHFYSYILFYKNSDTNEVDMYHGTVVGNLIYWMKKFSSWSKLGNERNKIDAYTIKNEILTYATNGTNVRLMFTPSGNRLLYNFDAKDEYIFFPFPPFFDY